MGLKQRLIQHISANRWQYLLITAIFIIGAILGNYKVAGLEGGIKNHLTGLIDSYLQKGLTGDLRGKEILWGAFLNQAKIIGCIWFLGLTVIGFPLILAAIFYRGFSLGFTLGFLVYTKERAGILISILSIFPQNLVYIPFLIMWAVIGINFSTYLVKARGPEALSLRYFLSFTILFGIFLLIFLAGAVIEAFLSPWFLKLFT